MRTHLSLLPLPLLGLSALVLGACAPGQTPARASASIVDAAGQTTGTASFEENAAGTLLTVRVTGLPPNSKHGFHVHTNPACTDTTDPSTGAAVKFGGAGAHFDPKNTMKHAGPNVSEDQGHAGDLPNLVVDAAGVGTASLSTKKLTVRAGPLSVIDHAVIVHANEDNYTDTPPLGGSGGRIGCGVIRAS